MTPNHTKWCPPCARERKRELKARQQEKDSARRRSLRPMSCVNCAAPITITSPTSFSRRCPTCQKARKAERARTYYALDTDKFLERARAYRAKYHEKVLARTRRWRVAQGPALNERRRQVYAINPEPHRESARIRGRKRYAAMHSPESDGLTKAQWNELLDIYDRRCAYCFSEGPLTMDHVYPLSRGGRHSPDNVAPACRPCNISKLDRLLIEWVGRKT